MGFKIIDYIIKLIILFDNIIIIVFNKNIFDFVKLFMRTTFLKVFFMVCAFTYVIDFL